MNLSIQQVAGLPSVIGTAPIDIQWSPESDKLAFLWNHEGWPTRDVWVVNADGSDLARLTDLRQLDKEPHGVESADLEAFMARRSEPGATEVVWTSHDRVAYVHDGAVSEVDITRNTSRMLLEKTSGAISHISVSPDRSLLAFLRGGDLWKLRLAPSGSAGTAEPLTSVGVKSIASVALGMYPRPDREVGQAVWASDLAPYSWSPDSLKIVFHMTDRRHIRKVNFPLSFGREPLVNEVRRAFPGDENERRTLHLLDVATGKSDEINLPEPGWRAVSDYQWSSSGQLLIDTVSDTGTKRWLYVARSENLTDPALVWQDERPSRIYPAYVARWHSNGRQIVVVADLATHDQLYVLDPETQPVVPQPITPAEWTVAGERGKATVQVISKTHEIYFTAAGRHPSEREIYRMSESDPTASKVGDLSGIHDPVVSPDGRYVASLWSDDSNPTQLVLGSTRPGASLKSITALPAEFGNYNWVRPRYEWFINELDGHKFLARIFEPQETNPATLRPVVFGPLYSNTVRNRWGGMQGTFQQYLVQQGYVVVQVDMRGSVGYGREFREAFLMEYGGKDLGDIDTVVAGVSRLPNVDSNRIGIWGTSYGGLLTAFALLTRPGMFAAGVAAAPALDPHTFGPDDVAMTRDPLSEPEAFIRGSALRLGKDLEDHLLIVHGMMDDVVPYGATMQFIERLMLLGKDVDLVTAPTATHAWSSREHHAVYFYRKIAEYFERHLAAPVSRKSDDEL